MANLSQERREKMLAFLETLKEQHSDDESLIALGEIERELKAKKYGLVWEEHEEEVDVIMRTHIPVFVADDSKEILTDSITENYNFLLEGDNLHSLRLLEKTHRGNIDVIYIVNWSPDKKSNYNQSPHEAYHKYKALSRLKCTFRP